MNSQASLTNSDDRYDYFELVTLDDHNAQRLRSQSGPNSAPDVERTSSNLIQHTHTSGNNHQITSDTTDDGEDDETIASSRAALGQCRTTQGNEQALSAPLLDLPSTNEEGSSIQHESTAPAPNTATNTHDQDRASQTSALSGEPAWSPVWFSRGFLLTNAAVFALAIIALEVLYYLSKRNQGLATVSQNMHYLWTYGPLSILTIIASFWGQIEYRARQLTPWYLMTSAMTEHHSCVLLNYLTSDTTSALFRSIKSRHFFVSFGICGSLLMRLLIIFSTALLSLEYKTITRQKDFSITESFDLASTKNKGYQYNFMAPNVTGGVQFWAISHYNLSHPYEITSGSAVQSFMPSVKGSYTAMTADAQVFEAGLTDCETFNIPFDTSLIKYKDTILKNLLPSQYIELWRPWCIDDTPHSGSYTPPNGSIIEQFRTSFIDNVFAVHKCPNNTSEKEEGDRLFFTMESLVEDNKREISGLFCEPTYSLTRRMVTNVSDSSENGYQIRISPEVKENLELGARPGDITSYVLRILGVNSQSLYEIEDNVWNVLLNESEPQSDLSNFRNTSLVKELSGGLWARFSAFAVEKGGKSPSNGHESVTVPGTATSTEGRLLIQVLSLRFMETILGLLILFSLVLNFLFSKPELYRDPGPVGAFALMVTRNPSLRRALVHDGELPESTLDTRLQSHESLLSRSSRTQIRPSPTDRSITPQPSTAETTNIQHSKSRSDWWHPIGETWWFRVSIFVASIALVATLQALFHTSEKNEGLANVTDGYQKYTWTYIPTTVMALLGLAYSVADSTARVLHPFQLLKGNASLRDIMYDPASQVSFIAVIRAASNHHFALTAIIFTGLLAPMLTIATSGLYTPVPIPWSRNVPISLQDWFSVGNMSIGIDNLGPYQDQEDFSVFNLVEFSNMSFPKWTHDEYAFATIKEEELQGYNGNDTTLALNTRIPALRGNLNCSLANYYTRQNLSMYQPDHRFITIEPPSGCHTPHDNLTQGQLLWLNRAWEPEADYEVRYLEETYDIAGMQFFNYSGSVGETTPSTVCGDNRQHFWYMAGSSTKGTWDDITLIHCVPYIEALLVNASFSLPTFKITSAPIVPDEASATPFSNASTAEAIQKLSFNQFTEALENGTDGTPFSEFTGITNAAKFIERIDHLYRIWMAQSLHYYFRHPAALALPANTTNNPAAAHFATDAYEAILTDRARLRLVQNEVSTRILQGLLLAISLCVALASILEPRTRLLPRDPGSIASRMGLFTDGEVWKSVPEGAETWSDEEIKARGLFQGVRFRLGWWGGEEEGGGRKWFGVDGEKVEGD